MISDLRLIVLGVCIATAVIVFGIMLYSIVRYRRGLGREARHFHSHAAVEILWSIVPWLIVVGLAAPVTRQVLATKAREARPIALPNLAQHDEPVRACCVQHR